MSPLASQGGIHQNKDWNYRSTTKLMIAAGCRRAASIKTRIETKSLIYMPLYAQHVAGRHPSKQGLKLINIIKKCYLLPASQGGIHQNKDWNHGIRSFFWCSPIRVAGRHPSKQGLKRYLIYDVQHRRWEVAGRHPSKQGLKLLVPPTALQSIVESQGGIHQNKDWNGNFYQREFVKYPVAGRHPSKQGLKLNTLYISPELNTSRRAASIKTRIETRVA